MIAFAEVKLIKRNVSEVQGGKVREEYGDFHDDEDEIPLGEFMLQ